MRLSPMKVPTDEKLYIVSFERNRETRCFESETIGSTALASPSPGRLFSYSHGRSGAARARRAPCWSFSASVSAGCQRRLPDTEAEKALGVESPPGVISSLDADLYARELVTLFDLATRKE